MRKHSLSLDKELLTSGSDPDGGIAPNIVIYTAAIVWLLPPGSFAPQSVESEACGDPDRPFGGGQDSDP